MGHGGKRPGAGRKSNVDVALAREMFNSVIPAARRRKIIDNLARLAENKQTRSGMEAFRLLAPYLFGTPKEKDSSAENVEPFNFIEYVMPADEKSD